MPNTWVVYRQFRERKPHYYFPELVVTHVPDDKRVTRRLMARAGYEFDDGTYLLIQLGSVRSPKRNYKIGLEYGEHIGWTELVQLSEMEV